MLNTYILCCEYVCEWIGQNSKFELQENSFVVNRMWLTRRKGTDKDLAILRLSLEGHLPHQVLTCSVTDQDDGVSLLPTISTKFTALKVYLKAIYIFKISE